ncbi:hypothetical protein CEW83_12310 [Parazoarcus communis]|uniref:Uncharacterized protein n=1 Tax=Parazoarcus communis TaxID=41977 RepID=A0A2U8GQW5_9RHOO|nr:hypothetical protein [Parazoarcus communis]AWI75904.1 hypothetical protein CEW83_12310 [Parazoarcus communis]
MEVLIKSIEQQAVLSLHRVRRGFVVARTPQANQIRGLPGEFGLVLPKGICTLRTRLWGRVENADDELPEMFLRLIRRLYEHLMALDRQVGELEAQIKQWHRGC